MLDWEKPIIAKMKKEAVAKTKYIWKNFLDGMTAEEFFQKFEHLAEFWSMYQNDWDESTLYYEWDKPVKDFRIAVHTAEEGNEIGIGYCPYYCLEFLI